MAAAGGVGLDLDVARVPKRNPDLEPFEVMVSESQERMLAIVEPEKVGAVLEICARWETGGTVIGEVTGGDAIRIFDGERQVGDIPVALLVDECPLYDLDPADPGEWIYGNRRTLGADDPTEVMLALLASPTIASKRWAFEQYDPIVQSRTVRRPEQADAAVLQIAETGSGVAVSIDGNGRRVACEPYAGTVEAVLECAANLACVGAEPLGLTNCLNFGNPERPTVAWQLDRSTQGLADACEALAVPVVGGNVSLYNETDGGPIYPTPVVGMVGELPDPAVTAGLAPAAGDLIALIGPFAPALAGSELAKQRGELSPGLPGPDIAACAAAIAAVREAVRDGGLSFAHDVSDGGLACALAECAIAGEIGLEVDLGDLISSRGGSAEQWLFGEGSGGFVVGGPAERLEPLVDAAGGAALGRAGGTGLAIEAAGVRIATSTAEAARAWRSLGDRL